MQYYNYLIIIKYFYQAKSFMFYIVQTTYFLQKKIELLSNMYNSTHYRTRMANSALKYRIITLITARSLCNYNNILINFGQLYSNSCYTTFSIVATLGMCIACEFHQLWTVRPCIYHIFRHLTK